MVSGYRESSAHVAAHSKRVAHPDVEHDREQREEDDAEEGDVWKVAAVDAEEVSTERDERDQQNERTLPEPEEGERRRLPPVLARYFMS